jgi:type VI secretion system protein VasG
VANLREQIAQLDANVRAALELAARLALDRAHYEVGLAHVLAAMIESDLELRDALRAEGLDPDGIRRKAVARIEAALGGNQRPPMLSAAVLGLLQEATSGHTQVVTFRDLLVTMLRVPQLRALTTEIADELSVFPC